MATDDTFGVQADVTGIPSSALATVGFAQGLLRAVSADNVNPIAVIQVQSIGACFHSNGPWAAKLPDLLSRAPSARLERLSAWVGWAKGDTPSFMSQTAGGRAASLLCLALGNLYPIERCGSILHKVSERLLPQEKQNAGLFQLGEVCMCLENKLACLGFGNHFALQLTRLRQCFFEAGLEIPQDLIDTPTEEAMHDFLVCIQEALRDESKTLYYSGTKCAGPLLAFVLAMCPDDVRVDVNGEAITRGCRESIVFLVATVEQQASSFYVAKKMRIHTDDFYQSYIKIETRPAYEAGMAFSWDSMSFSWDGMLSSQLDIVLATFGTNPENDSLKKAIANLVASVATFTDGTTWDRHTNRNRTLPTFTAKGLRTLLGPTHRQIIQQRLKRVLCQPSDKLQAPREACQLLIDAVTSSTSSSHCSCHRQTPELWRHEESCRFGVLWRGLNRVTDTALYSLLVHASPKASARPYVYDMNGDVGSHLHAVSLALKLDDISCTKITGALFHLGALSLVGENLADEWWTSASICASFNGSTIYPRTLEFPSIVNPWAIQYNLIDGRLNYGSDRYSAVISFRSNSQRARAPRVLGTSVTSISPSKAGEHSKLVMTLSPTLLKGHQVLVLRCLISQSLHTIEADFRMLHLGLMGLDLADSCKHNLATPLSGLDNVVPTSVITPLASGGEEIGVTLTHRNGESQFLCCHQSWRQLYQGDCCIACAVAQARKEDYDVVIGGSPSMYFKAVQDKMDAGSITVQQ